MQENQMRTTSLDSVAAEQQRFMVRVYNWMGAGLGITGVMAFYIANTPAIFNIVMGNPIMPIVLIIAQIGLVFWLATRVMAMSVSQATGVFLLYAGLTGITFSTLFVVYTAASITSTFLVTAGTFGAMSFYGYTTKKDLTSWGSFLFMGLMIALPSASFVLRPKLLPILSLSSAPVKPPSFKALPVPRLAKPPPRKCLGTWPVIASRLCIFTFDMSIIFLLKIYLQN